MSAKKRIEFTKRFFRNLAAHEAYIALDNPVAAKKISGLIYKAAKDLEEFPLLGRAGEIAGTRELVLPKYPYTIIYRLTADKVRIIAVLHQLQVHL
jgi:addiction module RelE/StbE family toxin